MAYISVADAVERTGRGQTTIYRLCRKHEHTKFIMREDKKFLIDEEFLSKHYENQENDEAEEQEQTEPKQELIDAFIAELLKEKAYYRLMIDRKDEQLGRKDKLIDSLQERQQELYQLLRHQTSLVDAGRQEITSLMAESARQQPEVSPPQTNRQQPSREEVKLVYGILALLGVLLILAITYHDELRTAFAG